MLQDKIIVFGKREKYNTGEFYYCDNNSNLVEIPYLLSSVRAGIPTSSEEYVEKTISFDKSFIRNPKDTFIVNVVGNSMETEISEGDLIIVDKTLRYDALNRIVVAWINGGYTVKILKIIKNEFYLVSMNKEYAPIRAMKYSDFRVDGVVIHIIKDNIDKRY